MEHTIEREAWLAVRAMTEGIEEIQLKENYSGRGMYNATCVALVADDGVSGLVRWLFGLCELVSTESDEVGERVSALVDALTLTRTRVDNLGYGLVYYWPGVEAEHAG